MQVLFCVLSEMSLSDIQGCYRRIYSSADLSSLHQKELVEVLELNVQADHVNVVFSIPPKYSVSSLMGYLKGKLSTRLFARYEKLGKWFWGHHLWALGYFVSSVGLDEAMLRKYLRWQERKEKE